MRYPAVAGQFYSGTTDGLRREVEECFQSPLGPGQVPTLTTDGKREIKGAVVPHAGFVYSGPVAAHTFSALAADGFPETFVIIGPNHSGYGSGIAITTQAFSTPLGEVQVDKELARAMRKGLVDDDIIAHRYEHSIEVQLPFIKFLSQDVRFVPMTMGIQDLKVAREVGKTISEAVEGLGRDVVVLASSDFTHLGRSYGFKPVSGSPEEILAWMEENDGKAIEEITALDAKGFLRAKESKRLTICGSGPIAAMIEANIGMGASRGELLKYATSYELSRSTDAIVAYASIIVR